MLTSDHREPARPVNPTTGADGVTVVLLTRASDAGAAANAIRVKDELLRCDPGGRILIAPVGGDASSEGAEPTLATLSERCHVLPSSPSAAVACQRALSAAETEFVAFAMPPVTAELGAGPELLSLAGGGHVVMQEGRPAMTSCWRQCRSWLEWLLVSLLYGAKYYLPPGSLVLARRELWERDRQGCNSPFVLTDRIADMAEAGAGVVRLQASEWESDVPPAQPPSWSEQWRSWGDLLRCWWANRQFSGASEPIPTVSIWPSLLLIWLIGGMVLLTGLNTPLLEPDEGRHAEIAREMWRTGDWLAPQFQFRPYLDKPPLLYWLLCASYSLFGLHDWAARLVPALCGLVTVSSMYVLGRRLIGQRGAFAAAIMLAVSLGFATCTRFLILESLLTMNVVLALLLGVQADSNGTWRWNWWLASAVACGFGLLTKGPIALVLIAPPLAAHHWLTSSAGPSFWRRWLIYGGTAAAISLPWFIAVLVLRPEFLSYFFWQHNLNRFLSGTNHEHSVFFYVPVMLIGLLPWTLLMAPTVRFLLSRVPSLRPLRSKELGLLVLWPVWSLGFFTAAAGKLPYYILSAIPPLMLLMGHYLNRVAGLWSDDATARRPALDRLHRGTWLVIGASLGIAPVLWLLKLVSPAAVLALSVMWLVLLGLQRVVAARTVPRLSWWFFCLVAVAAVMELTQGGLGGWQRRHAVFDESTSQLAGLYDPRTRIICVGENWGSVPFYLRRDDIVCVDVDELTLLADLVDPHQRTLLLVEYKLPLELIETSLPASVDTLLLARSSRVLFAEVVPSAGNLDD